MAHNGLVDVDVVVCDVNGLHRPRGLQLSSALAWLVSVQRIERGRATHWQFFFLAPEQEEYKERHFHNKMGNAKKEKRKRENLEGRKESFTLCQDGWVFYFFITAAAGAVAGRNDASRR